MGIQVYTGWDPPYINIYKYIHKYAHLYIFYTLLYRLQFVLSAFYIVLLYSASGSLHMVFMAEMIKSAYVARGICFTAFQAPEAPQCCLKRLN